jgi:hypothetical protein
MVVSEVCVVSEVLCSISDGHYTESNNCSISDEEKGETRVVKARLPFTSYAKKNTYRLFSKGFSLYQHVA